MVYRFGAFELDEDAGELRRAGQAVEIQPKPLALLALLIRERERVVSQDELFEALWPGTAVTPGSLTRAVSHARRAIDDTHKGSLLRSVPRRGYRFTGEVVEVGAARARAAPRKREGVVPFVGREASLERLRAAWAEVDAGRGGIVLVSGPAGIGKTRLVEVFADELRLQGAEVVFGRCRDGEGAPVFWLWTQVLHALASTGSITPEPAWGELLSGQVQAAPALAELSPEQRFAFFDSVTRALQAAASRRPLVLVLEDLQWARSASLRLLEHLSLELGAQRLLLVATIRAGPRERGHPLGRTLSVLRGHPSCTQIDVQGLSRASVGALLTAVIGRPPPAELTSELFARTEGVPLFLREAVRLLVERGELRQPERIRRRGITLPSHAIDLIRRSLDALSEPCAEVVGAASVLGREFTLANAAAVARKPRGEVLDLLDEAVAAGVVEESPDAAASYRFTHALFQDAAYDALQAGARARLHLRAAERLESQHAEDPGHVIAELAHHHHQAIALGDARRAFECAIQAAERAHRLFAYEQAADHYEQAAEALEHFDSVPPEQRLATLLALGEAHRLAGDRRRRREVCEQAMRSAQALGWPVEFARAAVGFCDLTEWSPYDDVAATAIDEALANLAEDEVALRARLAARKAYLAIKVSTARAEPIARDALALARASGDPEARQEALYILHYAIAGPDHHEERRNLVPEMIGAAEESRVHEATLIAMLDVCCDWLSVGDRESAAKMRARLGALAGDSPSPSMVWHTGVYDTGCALLEGRLEPVEQMARDALLVGRRIGHPFAQACYNGHIMHLLRERGDFETRQAMLEGATGGRRTPTHWIKAVLGQNALRLGMRARAQQMWDELSASDFDDILRGIRWIGSMVEIAHLCADLDDAPRARKLVELLQPVEHQHGVLPVPVQYGGPVTFCLARLHESLGMADTALQLYDEAMESCQRVGARPTLVRVQLAAARTLARAGQRDRAKELEAQAARLAEEIGMGGLG